MIEAKLYLTGMMFSGLEYALGIGMLGICHRS